MGDISFLAMLASLIIVEARRVTAWRGNGTIPGAVVGKRGDSPL